MSGRFFRRACAGAVVLALAAAAPAEAGGWHGGHGSSGDAWAYGLLGGALGLGLGLTLGQRPVYAPPPVYYAPPTVYQPSAFGALPFAPVYPASGVVDAVPVAPTYPSGSGSYCREFQGTGVIGGVRRPIVGTACLGPDGAWRVVR